MLIIIIIVVIIVVIYYFVYKRRLYSSEYFISDNGNQLINKLMIVAHPDDELIFGGKELLKEKGWKVICVTNASRKSHNLFSNNFKKKRYAEFITVMNRLGHAYEIWDFEDNLYNANWDDKLLLKQLKRVINERKYDKIVTHNLEGEYGHVQHIKVSQLVHQLRPANLFVFSYEKTQTNEYLSELNELLAVYHSQNQSIHSHHDKILHQTVKGIFI